MENSNNKSQEQLADDNVKHPAPGADPGADIETVTPSTEKEMTPAAATAGDGPEAEQSQTEHSQAAGEKESGDNSDDESASDDDIETVSP